MADFFQWDPTQLSVKVKSMDDEHQELIKKMNKLHDAHANKASKDELGKLLSDLATYTVKHFADEEAYMASVKFEGLETHKVIHKKLLSQVQENIDLFKSTGELAPAFFSFLSVWLSSHIRGIDTKYGAASAKKSA